MNSPCSRAGTGREPNTRYRFCLSQKTLSELFCGVKLGSARPRSRCAWRACYDLSAPSPDSAAHRELLASASDSGAHLRVSDKLCTIAHKRPDLVCYTPVHENGTPSGSKPGSLRPP